mgnify:CR=1 FL=1
MIQNKQSDLIGRLRRSNQDHRQTLMKTSSIKTQIKNPPPIKPDSIIIIGKPYDESTEIIISPSPTSNKESTQFGFFQRGGMKYSKGEPFQCEFM